MKALFTATMPVPAWVVLTFLVLALAWHITATLQAKYFRDLIRLYWREQYGEDIDGSPAAVPSPEEPRP